jgi:hypothetical protein
MFTNPYNDISGSTALGRAFLAHQTRLRGDAAYSLPTVSTGMLDAVSSRSDRGPKIAEQRDEMAALLADPQAAGAAFRARFMASYQTAGAAACPLWTAIVRQHYKLSRVSTDYTLTHFDPSALYVLEEEARPTPSSTASSRISSTASPALATSSIRRPGGRPSRSTPKPSPIECSGTPVGPASRSSGCRRRTVQPPTSSARSRPIRSAPSTSK